MTGHGTRPPAGTLDYRVARLGELLAAGPLGELGVRIELRGGSVLLSGTVPSASCRDEVLAAAHAELAGVPVHCDIAVADVTAPDHAEDLL